MPLPDLLPAANWFFTIVTAVGLTWIFLYNRYLYIKPSILLVAYTHFLFQWPFTLLWSDISSGLPDPTIIILTVHLYILCTLSLSFFLLRQETWLIWQRVTEQQIFDRDLSLKILLFLGTGTAILISIYFFYVPISKTGLYALFFDPSLSNITREQSLKLLSSAAPKYAYFFAASTFVPLLSILASFVIADNRKNPIIVSGMVGILIVCAMISVLSGARSGFVMVAFTVSLAFFIRRGLKLNTAFMIFLPAILAPAVILSLMREGVAFTQFPDLIDSYFRQILGRVFILPSIVGTWYLDHLQNQGPIGIEAYPRLAWITGGDAIDATRHIGIRYATVAYGQNAVLGTINATSSFIFTSYAYLGLIAFPVTIVATLFLDIAIVVYQRINCALLPMSVGALSAGTLHFVKSEYSVVWLTHGFGLKLLLVLLLSWVLTRYFKRPTV